MESSTPGGASYPSDLRRGRDAEQIENLKKLIKSENDKLKSKRETKGFAGSDSEEEVDFAEASDVKRSNAEVARESEKKTKQKGVWRKGKFIPFEENAEGQYRDRAKERRIGMNPDYDGEIERMVEIDAEKSKYLGGDLKHTHLVKGLDYALLMKVKEEARRKEEEKVAKEALTAKPTVVQKMKVEEIDSKWRPPKINTYTGKAIYAAMQVQLKPKAMNFHKIAYEFDISNESQCDVPTVLSRSNADIDADVENDEMDIRMNCSVDEKFIGKLRTCLDHFRTHGNKGRRKKKNKDLVEKPASLSHIKATETVDIFADIDYPYHKNAFMENGVSSFNNDNFVPPLPPSPSRFKGKIFSGLGILSKDEDDAATISEPNRDEIAQSIKKLAESKNGTLEPSAEDGRIQRDVFNSGVNQMEGDSMNTGTYDVFPETADYEDMDDDDDDNGGEDGKPRSKLGRQLEKEKKSKRRRKR